MATYEHRPLATYKDKDGNKHLLYPITKADCVDGLDALLAGKETPDGAQGKADAVQANLNAHTGNKSNPHGVTAAQVGAANVSLSNVSNENFKSKAESAGAGGQKIFDQVIRTQAEFNALIASPTWLGAVSVCFDGAAISAFVTGELFGGLIVPSSVQIIKGINNACIQVKSSRYNFGGASLQERGMFKYLEKPKEIQKYSIEDITLACEPGNEPVGKYLENSGFRNFINMTRCSVRTFSPGASGSFFSSFKGGFFQCDNLISCLSTTVGIAFSSCNNLVNCTAIPATSGVLAQPSGFSACKNLVNCVVDAVNDSYFCYGECVGLVNCQGVSQKRDCFWNCMQITSCSGAGLGTPGYTFLSCSYLNGCKQGDTPSTTGFLGGTNTKVDTLTVMAT